VALHPELVTVARRFYEASLSQVPPEPELTTRLEAVRRIEQQLLANYGQAYELPAGLVDNVQSADAWVRQAQIKVEPARQTLAALVADSQVKFTRATEMENGSRSLGPRKPILAAQTPCFILDTQMREMQSQFAPNCGTSRCNC
jgi:hypothetical protein